MANLNRWQKYLLSVMKYIGVPSHIAFIMDGNRRYAKKNPALDSLIQGHQHGFNNLIYISEICTELGIKFLTVYAFSLANFNRKEEELEELFNLASKFNDIEWIRDVLLANDIQMRVSGDTSFLQQHLRDILENNVESTKHCKKLILTLCIAYGGRHEIYEAMNKASKLDNIPSASCSPSTTLSDDYATICNDPLYSTLGPLFNQLDKSSSNNIPSNYNFLEPYLYNPDIPPPDLLIRTSGETRLSDFLIYQVSEKTSFRFISKLWPELTLIDFLIILYHFKLFG